MSLVIKKKKSLVPVIVWGGFVYMITLNPPTWGCWHDGLMLQLGKPRHHRVQLSMLELILEPNLLAPRSMLLHPSPYTTTPIHVCVAFMEAPSIPLCSQPGLQSGWGVREMRSWIQPQEVQAKATSQPQGNPGRKINPSWRFLLWWNCRKPAYVSDCFSLSSPISPQVCSFLNCLPHSCFHQPPPQNNFVSMPLDAAFHSTLVHISFLPFSLLLFLVHQSKQLEQLPVATIFRAFLQQLGPTSSYPEMWW